MPDLAVTTMRSDTAKVVAKDDAALVAERYLSSSGAIASSRSATNISVETISGTDGKPLVHIVNYGENQGYAIVSAQKYFEPVIAYSSEGHFDVDQIKGSPAEKWLDEMTEYIDTPSLIPDSVKEQNFTAWLRLTDKEVAYVPSRAIDDPYAMSYIMSAMATWREQGYEVYTIDDCDPTGYPYEIREAIETAKNTGYAPNGMSKDYLFVRVKTESSSKRSDPMIKTQWQQDYPYNQALPSTSQFLGCVPVAVSQVMYYHKHPSNQFQFDSMPLAMVFFDSMVLPNFIKTIGESCGINYNKGESRANIDEAKDALVKYGYNVTKIGYNSMQITNSLLQKRPVLFGGSEHMWICDGFHSAEIVTHYELLYYTGDFAEIDPTLAFGRDIENNTYASTVSMHMIWGWDTKYNGNYSGMTGKWNVALDSGTQSFSCSDALINISPK